MKKYILLMIIMMTILTGCQNKETSSNVDDKTTNNIVDISSNDDKTTIKITETIESKTTTAETTATSNKTTNTTKKSSISKTTKKTTSKTTKKKTSTTKKTTTSQTIESTTEFVCEPKASKKNIPVYKKANCVKSGSVEDDKILDELATNKTMNYILLGTNDTHDDSPVYQQREKCDDYFESKGIYSPCYDRIRLPIEIRDVTGKNIYGYAVKFYMYYDSDGDRVADTLIAEGWVREDRTIKYTMKKIPY